MKSSKCRECGFVGWADAEACKRCGAPIASQSADQALEQPRDQPVGQTADHQALQQSDEYQTHYYPAGTNPFPEELKTGWAITSLVIGIANFLFLGITLISILVGIIISIVALKKIKRDPFQYGGKGMAVAGLVTNIVSVVVLVPILMIAAIAIPNLLASRRAANEGNAIHTLRTIHEAEQTYQATRGDGNYGTLADLYHENLISAQIASGTRSGYRFNLEVVEDRGDGLPGFAAVGVPTEYGSTGRRSFFVDDSGVFRGGDMNGGEPTKYDSPLNLDRDYSSPRSNSRRSQSVSDY